MLLLLYLDCSAVVCLASKAACRVLARYNGTWPAVVVCFSISQGSPSLQLSQGPTDAVANSTQPHEPKSLLRAGVVYFAGVVYAAQLEGGGWIQRAIYTRVHVQDEAWSVLSLNSTLLARSP